MSDTKNTSRSNVGVIRDVLSILPYIEKKRRIQLVFLLFLILSNGLAELLSLATVIPFIGAVTEPERLWNLEQVQPILLSIGFTESSQLLLPFTLLFALAAIFSTLIRLLSLWINEKIVALISNDFKLKLYKTVLTQPYEFHLAKNSASIISIFEFKIDIFINAIRLSLRFLNSLAVVLLIMAGLLVVNWPVALITSTIFAFSYLIISVRVKKTLNRSSKIVSSCRTSQVVLTQESLGSIRDVILDGSEDIYLREYDGINKKMSDLKVIVAFLNLFPRYTLEAISLVILSALAYILATTYQSPIGVLTLLGTLALSAQKLLPAMQTCYISWADLNYATAFIKEVLDLLQLPLGDSYSIQDSESLELKDNISINNLSFHYEGAKELILNDINLVIKRGERVAIVGSTGSGKSTLMDLLMGLIKPTKGEILIDNTNIYSNKDSAKLNGWRYSIAHVPQSIYLSDSSIYQNIAFGIPLEEIDFEKVREAARAAMLAGYIESLPNEYNTVIGERGVRLSGGQRQRIAIARALYKKQKVIFLDEATTALDNKTESAVIKSIYNLSKDITIIMIAHRLSTIANCDKIITLEKGVITKISSNND